MSAASAEANRNGCKVLAPKIKGWGGYLGDYFKCCNLKTKPVFSYEIFKPEYKFIAYYVCPNCAKRWFEEIKENSDKPKYYYDNAATELYKRWLTRLNSLKQGTFSNQTFYFGTYQKHKDIWITFRTNFNNEKELISKQRTKIFT